MQPNLHINYAAIVAAVAAGFAFGGLWYGPLFGKMWAALMGMHVGDAPSKSEMKKAFLLNILGAFLTAYVLTHDLQVWRPSVWGAGEDGPSYLYGFFGGFFIWLGYYVPMLLGAVAWERRPWKLFGINAAYHFINLQIIGMILAYWR